MGCGGFLLDPLEIGSAVNYLSAASQFKKRKRSFLKEGQL
jgi:hypothetical protein